ncbi:uncharacterized protein FN964_009550 isoform 1-T2 [Alca torda]
MEIYLAMHCQQVLGVFCFYMGIHKCLGILSCSLQEHGGRCLEQGNCPRAICFACFSCGTDEEEVWRAFFCLSGHKETENTERYLKLSLWKPWSTSICTHPDMSGHQEPDRNLR